MSQQALPPVNRKGPIAWMAKNTVAANILMWICILGGLLSFYNMRKEVFPEFELDLVTVAVAYPGASPEDVEQGIILSIEEAIANVPGIAEFNSTANEGSGSVVIEIDESEDTQQVYQKIQQEVDRIRTFPVDAERPTVSLNARNRRVVTMVVHGQTDDISLRNIAEEVRDGLLALPQVRAMTRHDNVDAAALAGCDPSLLRSTRLAGAEIMPPQV